MHPIETPDKTFHDGDAFIERVIQDLKPAHTDVHFTYER